MDQGKTAGIGNYILSETLYLSRVWPWAKCAALDEEAWAAVHSAATDVIARSYAAQSALASGAARGDVSATYGTLFSFELYAYRRQTSPEGLAVRQEVGPHGRSVFWVPERQTRGLVEEEDR